MRNICLALPEELIIKLDDGAKDSWVSRSEYIRRILLKAMEHKPSVTLEKLKREHPIDPRLLDLDDS